MERDRERKKERKRGKRLSRFVLNPKTEETRSLAFYHLTSEASEGQSAMEMVILYWVSLEERSQPCYCPDDPVPSSPAPAHPHVPHSLAGILAHAEAGLSLGHTHLQA